MNEAPSLSELGQMALECVARGWAVFPLAPRSKVPTGGSRGFLDASKDAAQIRAWWMATPDANVGIATGEISGLDIVDVDPRNGGDVTYEELEEKRGKFPATARVLTGGGGWHDYYQRAPGSSLRCGVLGRGIEIKSDGGYVVGPLGIHPDTGRLYHWEATSSPDDVELARTPVWVPEAMAGRAPKATSGQSDGPDAAKSFLGAAFEAASWLGKRLGDGRRAVLCPWQHEHSQRKDYDTSTVLFPPRVGESFGWFKCSHGHCCGRGGKEVLLALPRAAREAAEKAFPRHEAPQAEAPQAEVPAGTSAPAPEPLELLLPFRTTKDLPRFPVEALPAKVGAFVAAFARDLEVPEDLPGVLALGVLSSALQGKHKVRARSGWTETLNLYLVVALEPGEMKSPAFRRMLGPLYQHERELRAAWRDECDRIKAANSSCEKGDEQEEPPMPRLFADDATPEALAGLLAKHGERLTIASDEGTPFAQMCGLYTQTPNNGLFLKAHDGGHYTIDRKLSSSIHLEEPLLTMALAVQPEVVRGLALRPELRGQGLWARFAYAFPFSRVGTRTFRAGGVDRHVEEAYRDTVLDLARRSPPEGEETGEIGLSADALERLRVVSVAIDQGSGPGRELAGVRDWASKLRGLLLRIAGLLHLTDGHHVGTPLSAATLERAIALGRYFLAHARHAFEQEMTLDKTESDAQRLLETIERKGWKQFSLREVQHSVAALRKKDVAEAALGQLVERGYLAKDKPPSGRGSRSLHYLVLDRSPKAPPPPATTGPPSVDGVDAC